MRKDLGDVTILKIRYAGLISQAPGAFQVGIPLTLGQSMLGPLMKSS